MVEVTFATCVNNVSGCNVFATCLPETVKDEVNLMVTGNKRTGTIAPSKTSPACTINFDLTGTRK